jgi:hypothetical protein
MINQATNRMVSTAEARVAGKYIAVYGAVPVRFNHNHCGWMWELTGRGEATRFETKDEALAAALGRGIPTQAAGVMEVAK